MTTIAELKMIIDDLQRKTSAEEISILSTDIDLRLRFWFASRKDRRYGVQIAPSMQISVILDMNQELDRNNTYFQDVVISVKRERNHRIITASTEPAPGADHQPQQPAPQTDPTA